MNERPGSTWISGWDNVTFWQIVTLGYVYNIGSILMRDSFDVQYKMTLVIKPTVMGVGFRITIT